MVSEACPVRGGKSPRRLAVKLTGVTANNLPSTKSAKKRAVKKKHLYITDGTVPGKNRIKERQLRNSFKVI
jgi:hypothetical protein